MVGIPLVLKTGKSESPRQDKKHLIWIYNNFIEQAQTAMRLEQFERNQQLQKNSKINLIIINNLIFKN
jgi:hypothetical protein